nr:MAG TPA: hypothetical protein [Caudoviricetes sp.]
MRRRVLPWASRAWVRGGWARSAWGVYGQAGVYVAPGRAWEGEYDHRDSLRQAVFILCILVVGYGKFEITLKRLLVTTRILLEMKKVNFRAGIIF